LLHQSLLFPSRAASVDRSSRVILLHLPGQPGRLFAALSRVPQEPEDAEQAGPGQDPLVAHMAVLFE
jgi:hypothetical protein